MSNIIITGPTASGKTTYLAALSCWQQIETDSGYKVRALNADAKSISDEAVNIIMEGETLLGTKLPVTGAIDLPVYAFQIEVPQLFGYRNQTLNFTIRDYAGELFDKILPRGASEEHQEYWEEGLRGDVVGLFIMIPDWRPNYDRDYSQKLKGVLALVDAYDRSGNLRIALVLSKCERGEIWPGRSDPEFDIFACRLPMVRQVLLSSAVPRANLAFFASSTFGVRSRQDPRPNRKDLPGKKGMAATLKWTDCWQPYNLFAPLYWLITGKKIGANV